MRLPSGLYMQFPVKSPIAQKEPMKTTLQENRDMLETWSLFHPRPELGSIAGFEYATTPSWRCAQDTDCRPEALTSRNKGK